MRVNVRVLVCLVRMSSYTACELAHLSINIICSSSEAHKRLKIESTLRTSDTHFSFKILMKKKKKKN